MNINWKEIKEKYPNAFKKFEKVISILKDIEIEDYFIQEIVCYCDIEKFFDNNGIIILNEITYEGGPGFTYYFSVYPKRYKEFEFFQTNINKNKDICKEQAIIKAFEILEKQLV